jgi:capsular exopolysaccharide synthesis family protein
VDGGAFLVSLLRWWWIPVLTVLLSCGGMFVWLKHTPEIYSAHGTVSISSQAPARLDIKPVAAEESRELEQMRSVEQSLLSPTLFERVAERMDLGSHPSYQDKGGHALPDGIIIGVMQERIKAELRRGTRLVDIAVEDTDPELARKLVETLVTEYQVWTKERLEEETRQARETLAGEAQALRDRLTTAEEAMQAFREAHPTLPLEGQAASTGGTESQALQGELTRARSERVRLEAEYEGLKSLNPNDIDAILRLGKSERLDDVLSLARAINDKEAEFAALKQRYLEKHPKHIALRDEIAQLRLALAQTAATVGRAIEKNYHVALENENKLAAEYQRATAAAVVAEGARGQFETLRRSAESERELFQSVSRRLGEMELASALPASVLAWNANPMRPLKPVKPRKLVLMGLAGGFGGILGLGLALGAGLRDNKVRDTYAAERATGTNRLASIPKLRGPNVGHTIVLRSAPASLEAEAFRTLRASLVPPTMDREVRSVLFTSAVAEEGKSFCAVNYAASLALQGRRTLLIDADLRRPGLSRDLIQDPERPGLQDYLAGRVDPSRACFQTGIDNLYLLSSGQPQRDATELLAGTRLPALLEEAYQWFDRVVIDTPPVMAVSDALAIARYADRTCLVVREGAADRRTLTRASDALRQNGARLSGFVWNATQDKPDASADYAPPAPAAGALAGGGPTLA